MGTEGVTGRGRGQILVVMANGDVYYSDSETVSQLRLAMSDGDRVFSMTDRKSGARLTLQVAEISSIVEGAGYDR